MTDELTGRRADPKMEHYTLENADNLNAAIDGLAQFCHNFCKNCAETERTDDLVFRCPECDFERPDKKCSVKIFLHHYGTPEQIDRSTSMGSL